MRFGITILTDEPWSTTRPRWQAVEAMGFDHGWTYDHLVWGGLPDAPWRGALPTLAAAAEATSTLRLGTLVASPNFRHPLLLHRDAQAVEDVAGGRLLLGVGTGGDLDSRLLGRDPGSARDRFERFTEFVEVLRALREEGPVERTGTSFSVAGAPTAPLLTAPLLVAGDGPRAIAHAARVGDGWVTTGPWGADDVDDWVAGLREMAARFDDAAVERAGLPRYVLLDSPRRYSLASVAAFEDVVGRVAALGFTDLIAHWPRAEGPYAGSVAVLEQAAAEVVPRWR